MAYRLPPDKVWTIDLYVKSDVLIGEETSPVTFSDVTSYHNNYNGDWVIVGKRSGSSAVKTHYIAREYVIQANEVEAQE